MSRVRTMLSKAVMFGAISHLGHGFNAQLRHRVRELCQDQWLPYEQLRQAQLERLNALLAHCVRSVPYYRRLHAHGRMPDHVTDLEGLAEAPLLTKEMLQAEPEAFLAENVPPNYLLPRRSGGSTGKPLAFYVCPQAAVAAAATEVYANMLAGYRGGDPIASLWGSRFDSPPPPNLRLRAVHYLTNNLHCCVDRMDEDTCNRMLQQLQTMRPTVLVGYTSSLMEMAAFLECRQIEPRFPVRALVATAEPLTEPQRQTLERVFRRPVFNRYGSREGGLIGVECDYHQGLHLNCSTVYTELMPMSAPPGARRVVVTKLLETGMPFIRYDLGDYVLGETSTCPCGRGYPVIQAVRGRVVSNLRLPNGAFVAAEVFIVLLDRQSVREYRVVQQADYSVCVELVPGKAWDAQAEQRVMQTLRDITQNRVPLRIELREHIERPASGKLLPVVSHVPQSVDTAPLAQEMIRAA